jgi:methyl-accepting chemotaxis protein
MSWFRNRNAGTKLLIAFGLMAALVAVVGSQGIRSLAAFDTLVDALYERDAIGLSHLKDANLNLLRMSRAVRNVVLDHSSGAVDVRSEEIKKADAAFTKAFAAYKTALVSAESKALAAEVERLYPDLRSRQDQVLDNVRSGKALELAKAGADLHEATGIKASLAIENEIEARVAKLVDSKQARMKATGDEASATYASGRTFMIAVIVIAVAFAMGTGMALGRLMGRPLGQAAEVLQAVAAGDFTRRLELGTSDELGHMAEALNAATASVATALTEVREAAGSAAGASQQLSAASEQLSSGVQQHAASLEESAASLEEMTGTVTQNADNARQANQLVISVRTEAEQGGAVVEAAVGSMAAITTASKRIAEIITTIDEIAFQTNLLALNAAVEAARAGEQGRGFTVVASEVRALAQRSATASKEIKALITDSVAKVEDGAKLVNKSGETLASIVAGVKKVADLVAEISAASQEQSQGIGQVNKAVSQMDAATQQNAAQTEELGSTAQALAGQAEHLQELVARFTLPEALANHRVSALAAPASPRSTVARSRPATTASPSAAAQPKRRTESAGDPLFAAAQADRGTGGTGDGANFEEF